MEKPSTQYPTDGRSLQSNIISLLYMHLSLSLLSFFAARTDRGKRKNKFDHTQHIQLHRGRSSRRRRRMQMQKREEKRRREQSRGKKRMKLWLILPIMLSFVLAWRRCCCSVIVSRIDNKPKNQEKKNKPKESQNDCSTRSSKDVIFVLPPVPLLVTRRRRWRWRWEIQKRSDWSSYLIAILSIIFEHCERKNKSMIIYHLRPSSTKSNSSVSNIEARKEKEMRKRLMASHLACIIDA